MIPELFLMVSSVCFMGAGRDSYNKMWIVDLDKICIQQVSISTFQPVAKKGETVYRVIPFMPPETPKRRAK